MYMCISLCNARVYTLSPYTYIRHGTGGGGCGGPRKLDGKAAAAAAVAQSCGRALLTYSLPAAKNNARPNTTLSRTLDLFLVISLNPLNFA